MAYLRCRQCGHLVDESYRVCPDCGGSLKRAGKRKTWVVLLLWCILLALLIGAAFIIKNHFESARNGVREVAQEEKAPAASFGPFSQKERQAAQIQQEEQSYELKLKRTYSEIVSSAADAERIGNLTSSVWHASIFKKEDAETDRFTRQNNGDGPFYEDFNEALGVLFSDQEYQEAVDGLFENNRAISKWVQELSDPPEKYADEYEKMRELYAAYLDLYVAAVNPSGSYSDFYDKLSAVDESFLKLMLSMSYYLPD